VAASDAYNVKNTGRGLAEATQDPVDMIAASAAAGLRTIGCVGTAWACPIEGEVSEELVLRVASQLVDAGVDELVLGDTTGEANPRAVRSLVAAMKRQFPLPLSGHFHDARGSAMANALAALDAGIDRIEGALGGLGGHPPDEAQAGHSGNLCTEDFAALALAAGWDLGLRLPQVLAAGSRAETAMGRRLLSRIQVAGLPQPLRNVG
jgi:hydroxymethylglutaryl-CoA lyase